MTAQQIIIERLLANSSITALVGTRVYLGRIPQGESHDAIVLNVIDGGNEDTQDGPAAGDELIMQIDAYASTPQLVWSISELVEASLNGYTDNNYVSYIHRQRFSTGIDDELKKHRASADYHIRMN